MGTSRAFLAVKYVVFIQNQFVTSCSKMENCEWYVLMCFSTLQYKLHLHIQATS